MQRIPFLQWASNLKVDIGLWPKPTHAADADGLSLSLSLLKRPSPGSSSSLLTSRRDPDSNHPKLLNKQTRELSMAACLQRSTLPRVSELMQGEGGREQQRRGFGPSDKNPDESFTRAGMCRAGLGPSEGLANDRCQHRGGAGPTPPPWVSLCFHRAVEFSPGWTQSGASLAWGFI